MLQFLVLLPIAISVYPDGYSHTEQFLSELGCVQTSSHLHAYIFNISLAVFALGLCWLFGSLVRETFDGPIELLVIGEFGFGAAIALILVALLPFDVFPRAHNIAFVCWLLLIVPMFTIWLEWVRQISKCTAFFMVLGRVLQIVVLIFPLASCCSYGPLLKNSQLCCACYG